MKDLVTLGSGNSRFLRSSIPANITFADFVSMLRNGTFPIDFAGLNPDGIIQAGTPINKATMLTDETGSAIGLEENDRTVNNALMAIWQNGVKNLHYVEYLTSTNWTAPENIAGKAIVICVGGGGGGGGINGNYSGGGGGSGYIEIGSFDIAPGQTYRIVIGAGGAGGAGGSFTAARAGENGGSTSFGDLLTANGGEGGKIGTTSLGGNGEAGGGAGGTSSASAGRNGGNGRTYGGGGGAGLGNGRGGNGGTYGAGGGKSNTSGSTYGTAGSMAGRPFSDVALIYGSHSTEFTVDGTDGFGGHNGAMPTNYGGGYGGGGYGGNGGDTSSANGGAGGGGFGGNGGKASNGGGGGGGYFGAGGDGASDATGKDGVRGAGGGGAGRGSGSSYRAGGNGGSGVVAIIYSTKEAVL